VETTGLNSSEVLATLFELKMKGIIRQLPGKAVHKGLIVRGEDAPSKRRMHRKEVDAHQETSAVAARRYRYKGSEKDTHRPVGPSSGRI
jgi:hypothetical protein